MCRVPQVELKHLTISNHKFSNKNEIYLKTNYSHSPTDVTLTHGTGVDGKTPFSVIICTIIFLHVSHPMALATLT